MSFREIKEDARKLVHEHFAYDASYVPPLGFAVSGLRVRRSFSRKNVDAGAIPNIPGFAESIERPLTATFLVSDMIPERNGRILFEDGIECIVKLVYPTYGLTVTAEVEIKS